jgi:cytidylate kinase
VDAAGGLSPEDLADPDALRAPEVAQAASQVAVIPQVRDALLDFQRAFATRSGGAVLDGRDIGTVICPHADVKLFVTASAEVRAQRRLDEMLARGLNVEFASVLNDVKTRDARDAERATAPMVPAEDALILDTSALSAEAAIARAIAAVEAVLG